MLSMGLISELKSADRQALEDLNIHLHEKFHQEDKSLEEETGEGKTFEEKEFLKEEVESTLEKREEILEKLGKNFGVDKKFMTDPETRAKLLAETRAEGKREEERLAALDRKREESRTERTSRFTTPREPSSNSDSGRYSYRSSPQGTTRSRDRFADRVERVEKGTDRLFGKASELGEKAPRRKKKKRRKRRQQTLIGKLLPHGSKRRKGVLTAAVLSVEALIVGVAMYQVEAKAHVFEKKRQRWEEWEKGESYDD